MPCASIPYKYIDAPRAELYDLEKDPGENSNIRLRQFARAREYKKILDELIAETGRDAPKTEAADLDQETMRRLATLGYVGSVNAPDPVAGKAGLADPKDKIAIFEAVSKSQELTFNEKFAEAAALLEDVLAKDPEIVQARLVLSNAYQKLQRNAEAKEQLDKVLKQDANHVQALVGMAGILRSEGRYEDVISLCQKTLQVDPSNTQALALMGNAYMDRKEYNQALPHLQQAAALQSKMTQYRQNLAACFIFLRQYADAEKILDDIAREFPKFPQVHFNLGLVAEEKGDCVAGGNRLPERDRAQPANGAGALQPGKTPVEKRRLQRLHGADGRDRPAGAGDGRGKAVPGPRPIARPRGRPGRGAGQRGSGDEKHPGRRPVGAGVVPDGRYL